MSELYLTQLFLILLGCFAVILACKYTVGNTSWFEVFISKGKTKPNNLFRLNSCQFTLTVNSVSKAMFYFLKTSLNTAVAWWNFSITALSPTATKVISASDRCCHYLKTKVTVKYCIFTLENNKKTEDFFFYKNTTFFFQKFLEECRVKFLVLLFDDFILQQHVH